MIVYKPYAFLTCFWCDEHYYPEVVAVGHGFHYLEIIFEGQVGYDGSADAGIHTTLAERFYAILHDWV